MIYGLLYFPYFSRPSNLTSWISGGPSVTIPHPLFPTSFLRAPRGLQYACWFLFKVLLPKRNMNETE